MVRWAVVAGRAACEGAVQAEPGAVDAPGALSLVSSVRIPVRCASSLACCDFGTVPCRRVRSLWTKSRTPFLLAFNFATTSGGKFATDDWNRLENTASGRASGNRVPLTPV